MKHIYYYFLSYYTRNGSQYYFIVHDNISKCIKPNAIFENFVLSATRTLSNVCGISWGRNKIIKRLKLFSHKDLCDAIHDTCRLFMRRFYIRTCEFIAECRAKGVRGQFFLQTLSMSV